MVASVKRLERAWTSLLPAWVLEELISWVMVAIGETWQKELMG